MPTTLLMEKLEDALHPTDAEGIAAIKKVVEHTVVRVEFSVPRNVRVWRLFRAMIKLTFEAQREPRQFPNDEMLLDALKMAVGYVREVKDFHGNTHFVPDSLAFGRLDEVQFRQVFDAMKQYIIDKIIPGVQNRDFEQTFYDLLREPGPSQMERSHG